MKYHYVISFDHTDGKNFLEGMIEIILESGGVNLKYVLKTTIKFSSNTTIFNKVNDKIKKNEDLNFFLCRICLNDEQIPVFKYKNTNDKNTKSFKKKLLNVEKKLKKGI